jgi:hypothetical protein
MTSGLQRANARAGTGTPGGLLVVLAAGLLLLRALPLMAAYAHKISASHGRLVLPAAALAGLAAFLLLRLAVDRRPGVAAAVVGAAAFAMVVLSRNGPAAPVAAAILGLTVLLGDAVFRGLALTEAGEGDLHAVFACGLVSSGTLVLLVGEAGAPLAPAFGVLAGLLLLLRRHRVRVLLALARRGARIPFGDAPRGLEAGWIALAGLFLLATWAGVQAPDLSWDGLAYHLPEARDIARSGHVRVLPDLEPQSLLWRGHDAYLSLGFLLGGESGDRADRVVQFLQCGTGLFVFGAALALARRLGAGGASALVVLALAAFPTAMLQLRSAYVDWPAALLVTAAAAQLAAVPSSAARLRTAGFLFGGAVAVKVFALVAAPALLILALRSRPKAARRGIAVALLCAAVPLVPWLGWSHTRAGSVLAPYAASPRELGERVFSGYFFTRSPASEQVRERPGPMRRAVQLVRLPYDLVFHSSRFEANGDGYNGLLVLLLLTGLAGWDLRRNLLFLAATLPFLVPWASLYLPSIRFLFPVYPLLAVFTAEGVRRLTGRFAGAGGRAAGVAVLLAAAAFPVHVGSSGLEWKAALGLAARDEVLSTRLPSLLLMDRLAPGDRVVFVGENDRFHCPAGAVWRAEFSPVAGWGDDPEAWRRGLDTLGITAVVWRSDREAFAVRALLGDRLALVAENGPARLYRVVRPSS